MVEKKIKLPKLGSVRFGKSREVKGRILSASIRRNPAGKYYIALTTEVEITELPKTNSVVGVDVGIKNFAILSMEHATPIRSSSVP